MRFRRLGEGLRASVRHRAAYALFVWVASHYAWLLPIAALGPYRNRLWPGTSFWSMSPHLLLIAAIWLFIPTKRAVWGMLAFVWVFTAVWYTIFGGWPTLGMRGFGLNVAIDVLSIGLAPLLVVFLLVRSDRIGPLVLRNWRDGKQAPTTIEAG